ncbi:unnamed protein product [Lactuca saligna]|uniref:Uncharacterized protein n=1 Tax=Lactuca saligna TaxID=75948 RepID=A0AA35VM34_LACSI|nr:unnamed protein product [Lactuca saligna]
MEASLFTFSSTSRRVIPAPNSDVHRGLGLDDFVNFLVSCRLRYAISEVPSEFFPEQVCEFYYTATVNDENNVISGTIGCGRRSAFITADLLSVALKLPLFEPFSELPTIERCRRLFNQLGYDHSKFGARSALILRQCMTPGWKFFTGALCKCVGHKSRSGDQLSTYEQQVVCSLLLNKHLDYGDFFFDQLVQLLHANVRTEHVPFPCWIALVMDKCFAEAYYSHSGNPIQCPRMSVRMYQDDPLANDIGIYDRMREWIANPYTVPSLTADTDEGANDNNEIHADLQAEMQDGGHLSPQLSHHTLSVTERVHSAPGEQQSQGMPPSPGEQPLQGEQHDSQEVPGTQFIQIPASAFNELLTLTRDMSQRLLRIEADVHQLKGVLLSTPSPGPKHDVDQKRGENDLVELGSEDNILNQTEPPQPVHESDKIAETEKPTDESDRPADTEKLAEDSEHDDEDEHDDECQMLDMNFFDPTVPVQGEASDDDEDEHDDECQMLDMNFIDPIVPVQGEDSNQET